MTRNLSEDSANKRISSAQWDIRQLYRRPLPAAGGLAIFEIKVFEDAEVVTAGDGKFKFDIPSDLNDSVLVDFEAWVTGESSSGDVVVSLYNNTTAADMLSTPARIDVGELNDRTSGTPFVIDTANDDVSYGDELWINVDNAGADALGLGVAVKFAPSIDAAIALTGAKGDPGGMSTFQGAWSNGSTYQAGDIVTNNNTVYIATDNHTASPSDEPGVGVNSDDHWVQLVDIPFTAAGSFNVVSSSGPVPDGIKAAAFIPFDATITKAVILADQATDAVVDIWKSDFAGYPPSSGNSITAATPPTLLGAVKNQDATLTGWTTAVTAEDILVFYVSGVTTARRLTLSLKLEK
jgi:hypothetical protein